MQQATACKTVNLAVSFSCALKNKGLEMLRNDSDWSSFCCWITKIWQKFRTAVLTYGLSEMRSVQNAKVGIFSVWNEQLINKSFIV